METDPHFSGRFLLSVRGSSQWQDHAGEAGTVAAVLCIIKGHSAPQEVKPVPFSCPAHLSGAVAPAISKTESSTPSYLQSSSVVEFTVLV